MSVAVRRRLTVGAAAVGTAVVGLLLAPPGNAQINGLTVSPSGAVNSDAKRVLTYKGTDADFEFGGTATFARIGGGSPFDAPINSPADSGVPPTGINRTGSGTEDLTDEGDGLGSDGPADAGVYNVSATGTANPVPNPVAPGGGNDTCSSCFTVLPAGPLAVTSIGPTSLRPGNPAKNISILGSSFERGSAVEFLLPNGDVDPLITANQVPTDADGKDVVKGITTRTELKRRARVDASGAPGVRDVRVVNRDGSSATCTGCFFVSGPPLTGISASSGANDPGRPPMVITFSGSSVTDGEPRLEFTGSPGSAARNDLAIVGVKSGPSNGSSVTASFDLQDAAPGQYQAVVRGENGVVNACEPPACPAFTLIQSNRAPTVTSLDRDSAAAGVQKDQPVGSTRVFDVAGTNLSRGVRITPTGTGVTVTGVEFVSASLVRATFVTAGNATLGDRDVTATLTDGAVSAACKACYTVVSASSPQPSQSSASPGASPTGAPCASGPPATPSSGGTPSGAPTACLTLTITLSRTDITPTQPVTVTARGTPGTEVELYAYSRPSTTYRVVRSGSTDGSGTATFSVTPGTNTRLYAHYRGNSSDADSTSKVITVHTALSLSAYRDGTLRYRFQGRNLPRLSGQLITLYRLDRNGTEVRTATTKTDSSGIWRIDRTFTGAGTFTFVARTSQTLNNAAGRSNERTTVIR